MEGEEVRKHVKLALAELPDDLREILVLRHHQNLKLREISEILNVPLGTVYSRLAEALSLKRLISLGEAFPGTSDFLCTMKRQSSR